MRTFALLISLVALTTMMALIARADDSVVRKLPVEQVVVMSGDTKTAFATELATNDEMRSRGLMFRRSMGEREAMLFFWREPKVVSMWMRNTFIPLDMLFVKRDGTVVHVAKDTVPQSLEVISAGQKVSAVLEINAGTANKLNIGPGSKVLHRFFSPS